MQNLFAGPFWTAQQKQMMGIKALKRLILSTLTVICAVKSPLLAPTEAQQNIYHHLWVLLLKVSQFFSKKKKKKSFVNLVS